MRNPQGKVIWLVNIRVEVVLAAILHKIVPKEVDRLELRDIDSTLFGGVVSGET